MKKYSPPQAPKILNKQEPAAGAEKFLLAGGPKRDSEGYDIR